MIQSSTDYKTSVYAPSRQVNSRVTITMDAFSQQSPQVITVEPSTFINKVTGSNVASTNIGKYTQAQTALQSPTGAWVELPQNFYDNIETLNGQMATAISTTNGAIPQELFGFDIIAILEKKFGKNIWQNRNATLADKVAKAKTLITNYTFNWYGNGSSPNGNKAIVNRWVGSSSAWFGTPVSHTNATVTKLTISRTDDDTTMDANGMMFFNAYSDASNGTVNATINTDYVELVLEVTQTTTRTFWDDKVVSANIVEEVSILNLTSPANQLNLTMDNTDNFFNFLNLNNMQTIIASNPKVDFEFGVILSDGVTDEWVVMGSFYIDNWKNNRGQMTITFTAHDLLNRLGNVSFNQQAINNAYDTAVAVLQNANITDYDIDVSLKNVLGSGRLTWSTNSRDLLQQIALATGMTLYQDRYGTLRINKFPNLSQASTYTTFTTGQASLFGSYASPSAVSKQDTDNGMRALTLEQMYDLPEVTLDQSVYQVKINVYSTNPNDSTVTEYVSTNPTIQGNNGQSFSLDIPLVQSTSVAQAIADSIFADTNYNAIYVANWRQNPVLMATDVIVINDSETSAKQTRVTKQEFNYVGYLSGTTESRGGI